MSQKIKSLLKDSNQGSKDSSKLQELCKETLNKEVFKKNDKKEEIDKKIINKNSLKKNTDSDEDDEKADAKLQEFTMQKMKQLQIKISEKQKEIEDLNERIKELDQENTNVKLKKIKFNLKKS